MGKNNAKLYDLDTLLQAGIDPKTRLPIRLGKTGNSDLTNGILKALRIVDEQDAINRYRWFNLPGGLSSQELERLLYYKGQLAFFYDEKIEQFYFMPYALDGMLDFYTRFRTIHPVPLCNGTGVAEEKSAYKNQLAYLSTLKLDVVYDVITDEEQVNEELLTKSAVLLHDYSKQMSQTIIPRQIIQDPVLNAMADIIPFMKTSLMLGTGVKGLKVQDADQADSVVEANKQFRKGAEDGLPLVPITATVDLQEILDGAKTPSAEFMLAMQSLDNFRLSLYGIENGGLFEKKAHKLETEAHINGGAVNSRLQDGLSIRQHFCNIVNSIWALGIWCEISENETMVDVNGDGVNYDRDLEGGDAYDDGTEVQS